MTLRRSWRTFLLACASASALWLLASVGVLWLSLRRARPMHAEPLPAQLADKIESLRLATEDGEEIGAWFLDSQAGAAPSVVLLHGRGGTRSSRLRAAEVFRGQGCAVLLVTHRAHGDSSGARDDFGWSARFDVRAAVRWLAARRPGSPLVVCGTSLGAAAATFAAGELAGLVDGYILECLYRDLDSAARQRAAIHLPPGLDRLAHAGLRCAAALLLPRWREIAPIDAIASIPGHVPVLLLAGSLDSRAPVDDAEDLRARIAGQAELRVLQGARHAILESDCPGQYEQALVAFLPRASEHRRWRSTAARVDEEER